MSSKETDIKKIEYICKKCKCVKIKEKKIKKSITEKKCKKCEVVKDVSEFHSNGKSLEGCRKKYKSQCKECIKEKASKLYYKRKEKNNIKKYK